MIPSSARPTHFSFTGFSTYPSTKIYVFSSPGSRAIFRWWEPTGDQPLATEFFDWSFTTTEGALFSP